MLSFTHSPTHPLTLSPIRAALAAVALAAVAALAAPALAQDLGIKAPPQEIPVVIHNAAIHPISGPDIPVGSIEFDRGVITRITAGPTPKDAIFTTDKTHIDAAGKHVYPGLISANTQLGLTEMAAVRATNDINETGGVTPEARAIVAVNPDSTLFPVTRANGILVAAVFPEGGRIPGQVGVMRLDGWTWEQMAVLQNAGLVVEWPSMRPITAWWMDRSEEDQQKDIRESLAAIDDTFKAAEAYAAARAADPATPIDLRYEAMLPVLALSGAGAGSGGTGLQTGAPAVQRPVFIYAGDLDQITAAVTWAAERKLKPVIVGGRDAHLAADLLKKHDVPVIITGTHAFPKRADAPYDDAFTLPKRLLDAGVRFCIASADRTGHERNLPYNAATAAAHGLPVDAALKSLTLWPAQILGIDGPGGTGPGGTGPGGTGLQTGAPAGSAPSSPGYGSLEVGKSATLIVTTGSPLEVTTNPVMAFIDGRRIDLSSKQTVLAEKYREKYRQLAGRAANAPAAAPQTPAVPRQGHAEPAADPARPASSPADTRRE